MRNWRDVSAAIHRTGKKVHVYERSVTSSDEFNNPEADWVETGTTVCTRTYPNRNTEIKNPGGPRERDNPVFLFARGDEPDSGARIDYEGTKYELESPTAYDSHVAFFGNKV